MTAIKQILGGPIEPEWDLGLDRDFSNTNILSRVPDNIKSFYDVVLTNPGKIFLVNLGKGSELNVLLTFLQRLPAMT